MNTARLMALVDAWSAGQWIPGAECPVCRDIHVSTQDGLPVLRRQLKLRVRVNPADRLYQCPHCGQFYEFRTWMERPDWGECMEGITEPYETYCFYKRDPEMIRQWLRRSWDAAPSELRVIGDPEPRGPAASATACPVCGSSDVEVDGFYEFTTYLCRTCGNAATLDDWQRDEWRTQ